MGDDGGKGIIVVLLIPVVFVCVFALRLAHDGGVHQARMEAVAHGAAQFIPQPDGTTKFAWNGEEAAK